MARVKVCRLCGEHNEPAELFCVGSGCGTSLADVSVEDTSDIERREAEAREGEAGGAGAGESGAAESSGVEGGVVESPDFEGGVVEDESQSLQAAATAGAQTTREVQPAPCALAFPWGRVPVSGQLPVGREAGFSPISGQLDGYPTVSRRHAVVGAAQGEWAVQDLGSTNGTYVNGARLGKGETWAIQNGDQVGFSQGLQAQVEIASPGGQSGF